MAASRAKLVDICRIPPGRHIDLRKEYDPGHVGKFLSKQDAEDQLETGIQVLTQQQDKLYAQNTYALLISFQAMDAAGIPTGYCDTQ